MSGYPGTERVAAPTINHPLLPEEERLAGFAISHGLASLRCYVDALIADLSLFDTCVQQISARDGKVPPWNSRLWMHTAARDGIMMIYHFGKAMEGIRKSFRSCPTLRAVVNHHTLRESSKLFTSTFPRLEKFRHAVAHVAELAEGSEALLTNAFRMPLHQAINTEEGNINNIMLGGGLLCGRDFLVTIEGKLISCKISMNAAWKLIEILKLFYSGFSEDEYLISHLQDLQQATFYFQ